VSVYRVKDGETVLWPNGQVRAESGELFEGFEDRGSRAGRDLASAMLADCQRQIVAAEADGEVRCDMPDEVKQSLTFFNGEEPAAPKPKPKKKARAKKVKAEDDAPAD
jgi:hypothetical protein